MRKGKAAGALALSLLLASVLAGGVASAQSGRGRGGTGTPQAPSGSGQPGMGQPSLSPGGSGSGAPGKYHSQPLNLRKETLGTEGFAAAARARMRSGDCAGALDAFDLALRSSIDPTLNRDRGLCQERLGNPYPAIDDYRIYLTAAPDAADAEGFRQRLARLEMEVYNHSSAPLDASDEPPGARTSGAGPSADDSSPPDATGGSGTVRARVSTRPVDDEVPPRDAMETVEHDHDEMASSVRGGKGFSLAPFFAVKKWVQAGSSFGTAGTWAEAVGGQIRYSLDGSSALLLEAGYQQFNSTEGGTISGLTSQIGYELRIPLDRPYSNQLLLGIGIGLEYLVASPADASISGTSGGLFEPRVRVGYRHLLSNAVGVDLSLDGGVTGKALATGDFVSESGEFSKPLEIFAANVGLVWGL